MFEIWLPLAGGFLALILGGEALVRGAVQAATYLRVSPLVIGLTLVGFGTSTPELVTSVQAALSGAPGIAYGNIVGSNIANILLIGGLAALLYPIAVSSKSLRRDGTVMIAAALAFGILSAAIVPGRAMGVVCLVALAGYIYAAFRAERNSATDAASVAPDGAPVPTRRSFGIAILMALAGLGLVVLGGRYLVEGAVALARGLGASETVIGLTIVAVGTSMPELVTSVMAALRRQTEVAFGNIVGSNIYNILGIGGATMLIAPGPVPATIVTWDNLVMLAASAVFLACAVTGWRLSRREGAALLAGYAAYIATLWP